MGIERRVEIESWILLYLLRMEVKDVIISIPPDTVIPTLTKDYGRYIRSKEYTDQSSQDPPPACNATQQ